jgi:hypothetical protein
MFAFWGKSTYFCKNKCQIMTVIFQIQALSELEEISQWLAQRNIMIQNISTPKIGVEDLLKRLRNYQVELPDGYRFNRDEANER